MLMLSATQYNGIVDVRKANCLAFALGQTAGSSNSYDTPYSLEFQDSDGCQIPIEHSFIEKASRFGLKVKEVYSLEETDGWFAFFVWGWYPVKQLFGGYENSDFHVVRRNPDGTFEHKPDWRNPATQTTLEEVMEEYPERFHIFVLEE